MAYPTRNTALSPYAYAGEAAVQNLCAYLGAAMPSVDEYNQPLTVPVRSAYPTLWMGDPDTYETPPTAEGPAVLVSLEEWGREDFGVGMGALNVSADGTQTIHSIRATESIFMLEVQALSDPQRRYIADAVKGAVAAGYVLDAQGHPIENAIIHGMYARGVMLRGWRNVRFPRAKFAEPRPFGQYYTAEMRLRADMDMVWSEPINQPQTATVHVTATSDITGLDSHTDPPQIVTATNPAPH